MNQTANRFAVRPLGFFAVIVAALALTGCGINNIPTYEQSAKAAWSEVLNQYKRRTDLIPNLVESVKGFANQEKTVLTEVIEKVRKQATNIQLPPDILTNPDAMKKFQDAQATLGGALGRLMAVVERYPDIKSGQNFLALQSELSGTENRIAIARRDCVRPSEPSTPRSQQFPGRWWRAILYPQAKEMAAFEIPAEEQKAPKVDFSKP